jgi:predicted DNA-binding transcriptional regulator AlpA
MRLLVFEQLKPEKGIPYTRRHTQRKVNAGEFPQPIVLSRRPNGDHARIAWDEAEIDAWLLALAAEREVA